MRTHDDNGCDGQKRPQGGVMSSLCHRQRIHNLQHARGQRRWGCGASRCCDWAWQRSLDVMSGESSIVDDCLLSLVMVPACCLHYPTSTRIHNNQMVMRVEVPAASRTRKYVKFAVTYQYCRVSVGDGLIDGRFGGDATICYTYSTNNIFDGFTFLHGCWICKSSTAIHPAISWWCSVKFHASHAPVGSKVYQNTTIYHTHSTNNTFGGFWGGGWLMDLQ